MTLNFEMLSLDLIFGYVKNYSLFGQLAKGFYGLYNFLTNMVCSGEGV